MTAAHLMTRGTPRRLDYRFLGADPVERWWRPVQDWVVLEQPEVIVCGRSLLISGIPSARRDAIGTAIRYTLVVEDAERALARSLAAAGLRAAGRARLGGLLDAGFPADWVDAALGDTPPSADDVARRLAPALAAFGGDAPAAQHPVRYRSWVGALDDAEAVAAFLDRVTRLADGESGWAFTTSAIASVKGAGDAAHALGAPVAVLLAEGGPPEVVDLGKAQAGPRPGVRTLTTAKTTPSRARRWLVPLAGVVLLAAILVVVLITTVLPR